MDRPLDRPVFLPLHPLGCPNVSFKIRGLPDYRLRDRNVDHLRRVLHGISRRHKLPSNFYYKLTHSIYTSVFTRHRFHRRLSSYLPST